MFRASFCALTATPRTTAHFRSREKRTNFTPFSISDCSVFRSHHLHDMIRLIKEMAIKSSTMKHDCPAIIAPSILSADLARLNDDSQQMLDMGADWLHWYVVLKCICHDGV
jgi:hypothetical protein